MCVFPGALEVITPIWELIKFIPPNRQTMNLQGFTTNTPESEYKRVIRHEAGHALGFPHEHMRKASIMCCQPPGGIAFDDQPIRGGLDFNSTHAAFAALIYPGSSTRWWTRTSEDGAAPDLLGSVGGRVRLIGPTR